VIATVEALVAAISGVTIGFCLYFVTKPALVHVPFAGQPLQASDLSIGLVDVLVVAIGVPIAAAVVARVAFGGSSSRRSVSRDGSRRSLRAPIASSLSSPVSPSSRTSSPWAARRVPARRSRPTSSGSF